MQAGCDELLMPVSEQLTSLKQRVDQYQQDNQNVNVTRLSAAVDALQQTACDVAQR